VSVETPFGMADSFRDSRLTVGRVVPAIAAELPPRASGCSIPMPQWRNPPPMTAGDLLIRTRPALDFRDSAPTQQPAALPDGPTYALVVGENVELVLNGCRVVVPIASILAYAEGIPC
jgi:hypothetical protein